MCTNHFSVSPQTEVSCGEAPTIINGYIESPLNSSDGDVYYFEDIVIFRCFLGAYTSDGRNIQELSCSPGGTWNGTLVNCECELLPFIGQVLVN